MFLYNLNLQVDDSNLQVDDSYFYTHKQSLWVKMDWLSDLINTIASLDTFADEYA